MNTKDLIAVGRDFTEADINYNTIKMLTDALERLTQPVEVFACAEQPEGHKVYPAETVARLIAERNEAQVECARLNQGWQDANFERFKQAQQINALQEQVKMLRDVLHANKDLSDPNCPLCQALAATEPKEKAE